MSKSSLVTNGKIVSMPSNENYRNNSFWDKVDAKKKQTEITEQEIMKDMNLVFYWEDGHVEGKGLGQSIHGIRHNNQRPYMFTITESAMEAWTNGLTSLNEYINRVLKSSLRSGTLVIERDLNGIKCYSIKKKDADEQYIHNESIQDSIPEKDSGTK